MRQVFYNGRFVPESDAKISIFDSALMFGDMVFEMTRSFNKHHFKLEEHIDRLFKGIKILRIPIQYTKDEIIKFCIETSNINDEHFDDADEHRLMINVSRGPLGIYQHLFNDPSPTVIISDFPLKWTVNGMGDLFDGGINGVITKQRAISNTHLDPRIKNRSRLHYQMANIEASFYKGENNFAILLDDNGFVTEGTGDNLFFVKNNKVFTPKGHNILRGISRGYVFDLCKVLGLECVEEDITVYDAYDSDECFMTATPFCILPVTSIDYLEISKGIGDITKRILDQWSSSVGVNIPEQIKSFNNDFKSDISSPTPYKF
jgi:branched-chain amino acid aminotransferase